MKFVLLINLNLLTIENLVCKTKLSMKISLLINIIKALQALHYAPPLHLHQASVIILSKIKCVLHIMSLYIFARLQENLGNRFQVI